MIKKSTEKTEWENRGEKEYSVRTFLVSLELQDIIKRVDENQWEIPKLQRESGVWNKAKQSLLIDSILKGYPIPGIMIVRNDSKGKHFILDGLQRIQTIFDFKNNKFKLSGKVSDRYKNKKFDDLSPNEKQKFLGTVMGIQNVSSENPANDNSFMNEIFARINSGGLKLSRQEIRNAINACDGMEEIKDFAGKILKNNYAPFMLKNKNTNEIIESMFRMAYFGTIGSKINDIKEFKHIGKRKNVPLDDALDDFTHKYFKENKGSSVEIISLVENQIREIKENKLDKDWLHSFDSSMERTKSTQPTFMDSLCLYFGMNSGKLDKFIDQKVSISIASEGQDQYDFYKKLFQQQTFSHLKIIERYKFLFDEK
ncbi:MAG: DUF262 domain-containing protein [Mycoplasmataceae bacterium]|nr:DUF262 domain-containing protein [Mycoplasmataceae bacterium]